MKTSTLHRPFMQEPMEAALPPNDLVELTRKATEGLAQSTSVQQFYNGACIFVTGGTGFLGKLLVEKLLCSCPDIQTVYLLVRNKKGKDMHTRIDEMFDDPLFDRLKKESSKYRHKVVGVPGDCAVAGLGLSLQDRRRLVEDVNIVFHVAATVRFDEHIRLAMAINVHATRDVIELSKQMIHLKALVHVSTAYSNCFLKKIEEKFYDIPMYVDDLELIISKLDERQIQNITPKLLGQWPNTYTYTKALAESVVANNCKGMPIGVFRPAIVISTYKEPLPGWINNLYGPNGIVVGACKGILHTMHCDEDCVANIVPADMCVNALICAAWDIANKSTTIGCKENVPIYNYVSSVEKPITWGEFNTLNLHSSKRYPFSEIYWSINFEPQKSRLANFILSILFHYLPAFFTDVLLVLCGRKPQMIGLYQRIHKFSNILVPFCTREWAFTNDNVQSLWQQIDANDRKLFFFNMAELDWLAYFRVYIRGLRVYLFKDPLSNLPQAHAKHRRFKWLDFGVNWIFLLIMSYIIWSLLTFTVRSVANIFM